MKYVLPGELTPQEVAEKVTADDTVVLLDWEGSVSTRRERVRIQQRLFDSGAMIWNGAGHAYDWGYPLPWEHDGDEPGSSVLGLRELIEDLITMASGNWADRNRAAGHVAVRIEAIEARQRAYRMHDPECPALNSGSCACWLSEEPIP